MNAPSDLIIKDMDDLIKKLDEGIEDEENGNVYTLEEAYLEIKKILEK